MLEQPCAKPISLSIKDAKKIIGLKGMAYEEYKSARFLLNADMLHQAAIFMNTCLEKELKAYLNISGINTDKIHDTAKLHNLLLRHCHTTWAKDINSEFVKMLTKIYRSRYFDGLNPGYNFVINKRKFLAEFDYTYTLLISKVDISPNRVDIPFKIRSPYQKDIDEKNKIIFENNYILNKMSKQDFLNHPDIVYEFRIAETYHSVEIYYTIPKNRYDGKFDYKGLVQYGTSFQLSQAGDKYLSEE